MFPRDFSRPIPCPTCAIFETLARLLAVFFFWMLLISPPNTPVDATESGRACLLACEGLAAACRVTCPRGQTWCAGSKKRKKRKREKGRKQKRRKAKGGEEEVCATKVGKRKGRDHSKAYSSLPLPALWGTLIVSIRLLAPRLTRHVCYP